MSHITHIYLKVQQMNVFVLSVEQQEIEEKSDQEDKMREVALISLSSPDLVSETLTLNNGDVIIMI